MKRFFVLLFLVALVVGCGEMYEGDVEVYAGYTLVKVWPIPCNHECGIFEGEPAYTILLESQEDTYINYEFLVVAPDIDLEKYVNKTVNLSIRYFYTKGIFGKERITRVYGHYMFAEVVDNKPSTYQPGDTGMFSFVDFVFPAVDITYVANPDGISNQKGQTLPYMTSCVVFDEAIVVAVGIMPDVEYLDKRLLVQLTHIGGRPPNYNSDGTYIMSCPAETLLVVTQKEFRKMVEHYEYYQKQQKHDQREEDRLQEEREIIRQMLEEENQ